VFVGIEKISCSPEHPFWIDGKGWVLSFQLEQGMRLRTRDGELVAIDEIRRRDEVTQVYNVEIDGFHTYFVSGLEILSHNMCAVNPARGNPMDNVVDAADDVADVTDDVVEGTADDVAEGTADDVAEGTTDDVVQEVSEDVIDLNKDVSNFDLPDLALSSDEFSIRASVPGDPKAFIRAELPEPGVVEVTDIFRGGLPKGSGGQFLADTLKAQGISPSKQLVFKGIINEPTVKAFELGIDPANSVLGRTGRNALKRMGLSPKSFKFQVGRGRKLNLVINVK
jgi:hypothetical protein